MRDVTAAVILENGRVLVAQRAPSEKMAGKWEFPGGKIEPGETPQQCLKREIREELDMEIDVLEFFGESIYRYDFGDIRLLAYFCRRTGGNFTLKVHSRIDWAGKDELNKFEFCPADIPLAEKLKDVLN
jgi:8-oxo-dGTP diphosphatase